MNRKHLRISIIILVLFFLGILIGVIVTMQTGFSGNSVVFMEVDNGPFTREQGIKGQHVNISYKIDLHDHLVKGIQITFQDFDKGIEKVWRAPSEGQDFIRRVLDLDHDGIKEILVFCPFPTVVHINNELAFVVRPCDRLEKDAMFSLVEGNDGSMMIKKYKEFGKKGNPEYFKWNRSKGFYPIDRE